jgi:hypothetical protein
LKDLFPAIYNIAQDKQAKVSDYLTLHNEDMVWLVILLRSLQDWEVEDFTSFIDLLYNEKVKREEGDNMKWNHTKSGMFEVRSYYQLLSASGTTEFPWKNIWRVKVPHKVAFFTSLAAHGKNLTIDNLRRWQINVVDGVLCAKGAEKQGIISFFTVSMFGNCGRWFFVCLEFIGLCHVWYRIS